MRYLKDPFNWVVAVLLVGTICVPWMLYYALLTAMCLFVAALLIGATKCLYWAFSV